MVLTVGVSVMMKVNTRLLSAPQSHRPQLSRKHPTLSPLPREAGFAVRQHGPTFLKETAIPEAPVLGLWQVQLPH